MVFLGGAKAPSDPPPVMSASGLPTFSSWHRWQSLPLLFCDEMTDMAMLYSCCTWTAHGHRNEHMTCRKIGAGPGNGRRAPSSGLALALLALAILALALALDLALALALVLDLALALALLALALALGVVPLQV